MEIMEPTHDPFEQHRLAGVYQRLHNEKWDFDRGTIPNHENFHFVGLNREGQQEHCVVMRTPENTYSVYTAAGFPPVRIFDELVAWRRLRQGERWL